MDNFVVSARKYRPATFVSVIGQNHITSTLKNAILRGQLAHAYLFCGPRGVGKTTCARIFAKAINCLSPQDGEACNECESCKAFNQSRSFNIHELDAASNNSVDDIRSLTDQVRIPPQIGRYSVYIIDEVHMLSLQAFNAFLKTLEEPPAHAVFILATTEKHKIIPTILSRCQIYDFNRIRVEDGVGFLKYIASEEGIAFDEESLHIIAQKADGGMRDALSMFDKVVSFCGSDLKINQVAATLNVLDYDTYFKVTEHILGGDYTSALLQLDDVLRKGFSCQTFIGGLNNHFRDLLMCKNSQTISLLEVTGNVAQRYKVQAEQCSVPLLFEGINLLTSVDNSLRTATNQRLHVELSLMKLCGLGQKKNNDTLTPSLPNLVGQTAVSSAVPVVSATEVMDVSSPAEVVSSSPVVSPVLALTSSELIAAQVVSTPSDPVILDTASVGTVLAAEVSEVVSPALVAMPSTDVALSPQDVISISSLGVGTVQTSLASSVSLSGRSISSILSMTSTVTAQDDEAFSDEDDIDVVEVDQNSEELLTRGCDLYAKELMSERPRIGIVMSEAHVSGNIITLKVPNESSYDEVMRNLTDIQRRITQLSGVRGMEFKVGIEATVQSSKPIKIDDRLRFLVEKNPLVNELRAALELELE